MYQREGGEATHPAGWVSRSPGLALGEEGGRMGFRSFELLLPLALHSHRQ